MSLLSGLQMLLQYSIAQDYGAVMLFWHSTVHSDQWYTYIQYQGLHNLVKIYLEQLR